MKERLQQLITMLGVTATRFADEIDVQRSGISHILSGRNQPSFDFLVKILNRFDDINAEWLLLGKGTMLKDKPATAGITNNGNKAGSVSQANLFTPVNDKKLIISDPEPETTLVRNVTNVNSIKQVVLLNSDGTFEVYNQSK